MPKIDFSNQKIPKGYQLPKKPIELVKGMKDDEVRAWIYQELYKVYHSDNGYLFKEMCKEDIYHKLIEADYDIGEFFQINW